MIIIIELIIIQILTTIVTIIKHANSYFKKQNKNKTLYPSPQTGPASRGGPSAGTRCTLRARNWWPGSSTLPGLLSGPRPLVWQRPNPRRTLGRLWGKKVKNLEGGLSSGVSDMRGRKRNGDAKYAGGEKKTICPPGYHQYFLFKNEKITTTLITIITGKRMTLLTVMI